MATTPPAKVPKIEVTVHPDFRVVIANGNFGGLTPNDGRIMFYTDIFEPRVKIGGKLGEMEIERINRQCQIDVRMSVMDFVNLAAWMNDHIKRLEDQGILKKEDLIRSKQTDYSV